MSHLNAREFIATTVDPGSWESWDAPIDRTGVDKEYASALAAAAQRADADESVLTGHARIKGHDVALIVSEFRFMGGSIGTQTSTRILAAVRHATAQRLPLIAATSSGGTRMQEGTPAFVTMIDIVRAVVDHKANGLPYLVYLRNPTTGGVFASFASLGHLVVAEPGALIGFLGPAVFHALHGEPFPEEVQTAENLAAKGVLDAVVSPAELGALLGRLLRVLSGDLTGLSDLSPAPQVSSNPPDAWDAITITRRPDRPGASQLLNRAFTDVVPFHGTQAGEAGSILTAMALLRGLPCLVVAQDRRAPLAHRPLGPGDLRSARRGMMLAEQLRLPLVTVIDTPGAELSAEAEEGALAPEIARSLADMVQLSVPSVAVLLGQGCGGGALALLPARRVVAARNAWLAPLAPEGASAILFGSRNHAANMARQQRVRADDLRAMGFVHALVDEPADANPGAFLDCVADEILRQFAVQGPRVGDASLFHNRPTPSRPPLESPCS